MHQGAQNRMKTLSAAKMGLLHQAKIGFAGKTLGRSKQRSLG